MNTSSADTTKRSMVIDVRQQLIAACLMMFQFCVVTPSFAVTITEAKYEGRPQFKIETTRAIYYYDVSGGGFSRIVDRDGKDWVSFRAEQETSVPASAAGAFRGLPNLVYGKQNPDAGAGHPGFEQCTSQVVDGATIRTISKSGRWQWSWTFSETHAVFTMESAPPKVPWWFLYEGTPAGRWSPDTFYWGTDLSDRRTDLPDRKSKVFEQWRWAYFGDQDAPRVLLLAQLQSDETSDTCWLMGSTRDGLRAPDGMVVFGFGRGPATKPQLTGSGQQFAIGFVEHDAKGDAGNSAVGSVARKWIESGVQRQAAVGPLRVHPKNPRYFTDGTTTIDGEFRAIYLAGSHEWHTFQDHGHRLESGANPPRRFDYDAFLDMLHSNGHNFTRLWRWELPKWTEGDTKTKQTEYSEPHPWQRVGPTLAADGKPKFDLTRFNEAYFQRLRTRVNQAGNRGIYVGVMLFECWGVQHVDNAWKFHPLAGPNNVNGIEADENADGWGTESHSMRDTKMGRRVRAIQEAYVRKVLEALNDLDNVLYEIANEGGTYSAGWQNHMVRFIRTTEATMPNQHAVGISFYYSRNKEERGNNTMLWESDADWVAPADHGPRDPKGFNFRTNPSPDYQRKVVVADTDHLGWKKQRNQDWFWKQFCRGNHTWYLEWAYNSPTEAVAARKGIGQTVAWSRKVNLEKMQPSTDAASTSYCLVDRGREYLVYQPDKGEFTVDLRKSPGVYSVEWFFPQTNKTLPSKSVEGGSVTSFRPPNRSPAVLHIRLAQE